MDTIISIINAIRWLLAIPLLLVSAYFIVTNFRFLLENLRVGLDAGPAPVTVMGGLTGTLGLLIMPVMSFTERLSLIWIPLVFDLGSLPFYGGMLVLAIVQYCNQNIWKNTADFIEGGNK